jgi:hypothetical protein
MGETDTICPLLVLSKGQCTIFYGEIPSSNSSDFTLVRSDHGERGGGDLDGGPARGSESGYVEVKFCAEDQFEAADGDYGHGGSWGE